MVNDPIGSMPLNVPESWATLEDAAVKLLLAALLGGVLGIEREMRDKALGLRSNMLVALGACAFILIVMDVVELFRSSTDLGNVDPSRVIQGIVEGIGFLGTAAIIQNKGVVKGATTGAMIWVVGAVGIACGFGLYMHATLIAAIGFVVLSLLGAIERWLFRRAAAED